MSSPTPTTTLPAPAAQASKAALNAAISENNGSKAENDESQEVEVNMESQADHIRTVFSDPTNFNVKVRVTVIISSISSRLTLLLCVNDWY
jgi:hypothetical protein